MVDGIKRRSFLTGMTALGATHVLGPKVGIVPAGAAVGSARLDQPVRLKISKVEILQVI